MKMFMQKSLVLSLKRKLTMRAPDWWDSARFQAVWRLEVGSGKMALSRPAHQRVTPTVGQFIYKTK